MDSNLAMSMATATISNQLPSGLLGDVEAQEQTDEEKKKQKKKSLIDYGAYAVIGVSVVSSVVAIAFAATMSLAAVGIEALIYVGAGTSMVIAPYAIYQRKQLRDMDSMRRVQNKIRKEVNRLQGENDKLHNNVTDLTTQVDRVEECEKELSSITDGMGKSVNEFVDLVKEHKKINTEIKKHLQIQVLQSLMDVVIKSDRDNDGVFSAQELKMVKVFIRNIRSVTFHEDRFDKIMDENPTLKNLMRIVRNLLDENVSEDERVFELHVDKFMEAGLP